MTDIDEYLKNVAPPQKVVLDKVRKIVRQIVPDAEEVIGYGVPAFKYTKQPLIYMAAFKNHMSIYPAYDTMIDAIGEELGKFRTGKGTFQFTATNSMPDSIIQKIIHFRLAEISKSLTQPARKRRNFVKL